MGNTAKVSNSKYGDQKWTTHFKGDENQDINDLREFLWLMRAIDKKTKYEFVKYCILWCFREMKTQYPDYKEIIRKGVDK